MNDVLKGILQQRKMSKLRLQKTMQKKSSNARLESGLADPLPSSQRKRSTGLSTKVKKTISRGSAKASTPVTVQPPEATGGAVAWELLDHMEQMTWDRHAKLSQENAAENTPRFSEGHSLAALLKEEIGIGDTATVVAAGPSVKRKNPAGQIRNADYRGAIVASESAISYCLRNGVIPDLAVTVDPGIERVVGWLGDPNLTPERLAEDDYFARQDQDDAFADELRANEQILELLNRHGKDIRIAFVNDFRESTR